MIRGFGPDVDPAALGYPVTAFATLEIHAVLRTVLTRMRLRPASRRPARPRRRAVTLMPRTGARVIALPLA